MSGMKNRRDMFDPYFENKRKGWHQRPLRPSFQQVFDDMANLTDQQLENRVKCILNEYSCERALNSNNALAVENNTGLTGVAEKNILMEQPAFLQKVLECYGYRCCITGSQIATMVEAVAIKPWHILNNNEKKDKSNGICLNVMCSRAFSRGYLTIDKDYHVKVARVFKAKAESAIDRLIADTHGREIICNTKARPGMVYLEYHNDMVFLG